MSWTLCIGFFCLLTGFNSGFAAAALIKTGAYEEGFKDGRYGYGKSERAAITSDPLYAILEARRSRRKDRHIPAGGNS